jgi:hypothetical protein
MLRAELVQEIMSRVVRIVGRSVQRRRESPETRAGDSGLHLLSSPCNLLKLLPSRRGLQAGSLTFRLPLIEAPVGGRIRWRAR